MERSLREQLRESVTVAPGWTLAVLVKPVLDCSVCSAELLCAHTRCHFAHRSLACGAATDPRPRGTHSD
eukprot:2626757-Amphidinium_carterae.1